MSSASSHDIIVIGGGIVGLAAAYKLSLRSHRVVVLEKEAQVCSHQSGRNSGVLHSGIYYKPGSLKASTCVRGRKELEAFCEREGVPYRRSGKVIVATSAGEESRLAWLRDRGLANGVDCRLLDGEELRRIEPHCGGIAGLAVRDTGVVDFRSVCDRFAARVEVAVDAKAESIRTSTDRVEVITAAKTYTAKLAINCAGLHSDRVARLSGGDPGVRIVPFRGEYYALRPESADLCRTLIYPVPDPALPFLGVHFTRGVDDHVHCGPNAVLAFAREGYRRTDVNLRDLAETLTFAGFRRFLRRYWRTGIDEMRRSFSKRAFLRAAQTLIPDVGERDLVGAPAGVRAQAIAADGSMVDDFLVTQTGRTLNVLNAPSPAATACLAIADLIMEKALK
jgi:(S)-2-hydroxyglutarate dehydrogenase